MTNNVFGGTLNCSVN